MSAGLGMLGSVSRKYRLGVSVFTTASRRSTWSDSTAYTPAAACTPRSDAIVRRRMSASTRSTVLPDVAIALASSIEQVDLPSLGTELVMTMERIGLSGDMKRMFANRVFAAFWISRVLVPVFLTFLATVRSP